jgi:ABC-type dipeptide transport system, periplasmic component
MRVGQKLRWALGAAAVAALVLSGCSTGETSDGGNDAEAMDLLRWAGPGPVVTIDGSAAGDFTSMNAILLTSGQLTRFDEDRVPQLDLAESIELSDDGLSATVTLLPDLVYSDGTPVLAEDLQYAYERNISGTGAGMVASIESIDVVDERTAVINLKGVDPDLLSWLAERALQLHPKSLIESDPDYWSHPVSAGPYVVEEGWVPGDPTFRAVENPNYPFGPMAAKAIEIISVPDSASRILQLQTGEIDAALDLPLSSLGQTFPEEVEMFYAGTGGSNYLIANQKLGGPFANELVRQAMSLAVDRERISELAFSGIQPASTSPMYDCGPLCERNLLPNNGARDVEAAKALMAEAGYADGFSADIKVSSGRGGWQEGAVVVAESLADIGITLTVTPVDEGQHFSSITAGNYEMFFAGGGGHYQSTLSQMLREGDFWVAATGWTPPARAAELLAISASSLDVDERRAAFTEAQEIWMEASHVIPLVERVQLNGTRVPDSVFVPQIKNDQKVLVRTLGR